MANRHFVTVLGTGNYAKCYYEMEGAKRPPRGTPFVQIAVLENIMPTYKPGDKITVFATQTAEEMNWHSRMVSTVSNQDSAKTAQASGSRYERSPRKHVYGKKTFRTLPSMRSQNNLEQDNPGFVEENAQNPPEETLRIGLYDLLQKYFPLTEKQIVRIPEGKNSRELNEIFECIYRELSDGEIVYFDFTHGLRNLPMQALAVVNYAKVLKKIQVGGLYYGAYELGTGKGDSRRAPLLNITYCSEVLDWTSAAESFVKTGSSNQIKSLFDQAQDKDKETDMETDMETVEINAKYQYIMDRLYDLTNCLETSRGKILYPVFVGKKNKKGEIGEINTEKTQGTTNSIYAAYKYFEKGYAELENNSDSEKYKKPLIDYVYKDVKILGSKLFLKRKGEPDFEMIYTAQGMAAVKWAIKKKLIQQGYTALNETLVSYVCELYGARISNYADRRDVLQTIKSIEQDFKSPKYNQYSDDVKRSFRSASWRAKFEMTENPDKAGSYKEGPLLEIFMKHPETNNKFKKYSNDFREYLKKYSKESHRNPMPFDPPKCPDFPELPDEVFSFSILLGDDRNSLSHFGLNHREGREDEDFSYDNLVNNLSDRYKELVKIMYQSGVEGGEEWEEWEELRDEKKNQA